MTLPTESPKRVSCEELDNFAKYMHNTVRANIGNNGFAGNTSTAQAKNANYVCCGHGVVSGDRHENRS